MLVTGLHIEDKFGRFFKKRFDFSEAGNRVVRIIRWQKCINKIFLSKLVQFVITNSYDFINLCN